MSHQYQPTSYYAWPDRSHGLFLNDGVYEYVSYDYYAGDEIYKQNYVFRDSDYVTYDNTHARFINKTDVKMYDTSGITIYDSGTLIMHTSASPTSRAFVVDRFGRVGVGMWHDSPHAVQVEDPSFDLDVRGTVGVEDFIYHNDDTDTYMLFGADETTHYVNGQGDPDLSPTTDYDEINFRVGGIDMIQMLEDDTQDRITLNKRNNDVDVVVRSVDEPKMLFVDAANNRVSVGDSDDAPQATLEVENHASSGATGVPLVQLNNRDTDKQLLDINADNIDADVISVSADKLVSSNVLTITADSLTTGDVINTTADGLTTGSLIHMTTTSDDKSQVSLVHFESTGDRGDDTNSTVLLDLNFDTTTGTAARAVRIDTEQTTGTVFEVDATEITTGRVLAIDADKLTTGKGIELLMDTRTSGTGLHIHDDAVSDHAGALVKIEQDGDRSGTAASIGIDVNFDTTNNPNSRALRIDSEQRDGTIVEVDATPLTTGKGLYVHTDSRTSGSVVHLHDASTVDEVGALVRIEQDGDRTGTKASHVVNINMDTTNNPNSRTIFIDTEQRDGIVVDVDATEITTGKILQIDAQKLTTGKGIELMMNNRTIGTGVHVTDTSATNTAGALMKLEQLGDRTGDQASVLLDLNVDTTDNSNSRTVRIDSEQRNGTIIEVDATPLTTGKGLHIHTDARTNGEIIHLHDASTVDAAGALVKIEQVGDRSGNQASRGLYLNFDTTNNINSHAFIIDSEQRDGVVMELDASPLTTGKGIYLHTDNRTTGTGLHIVDDSGTDSAGRLVHIEQKGNRDGTQASVGLEINFDTTANPNARALKIDSEQTTGKVVEIDGNQITTGTIVDVTGADDLTTGTIFDIHSSSGSVASRDLVKIHNDNANAVAARALYIINDAIASGDGTTNGRRETVRFETTAADPNPLLELRNSNTAADTPPILNFIRSAGNETDNMSIGTITFEGKDSTNTDTVYAAISARATDKDNTTEAGEISLLVQATDSPSELRNLLRVGKQRDAGVSQQAEVVINEDQIDCDFRVETNTSNNAFVIRGDGSEIVFNENSAGDHNLRVESNKSSKMLFVDSSADIVEIRGPANDDTLILDVLGNNNTGAAGASLFRVSPTDVVVNESSNDVNFRIESDTNTHAFYVDGAGTEVVINDTGRADTDFRIESDRSSQLFFTDSSADRVSVHGPAADDTDVFVVYGNGNNNAGGHNLLRVSPTDIVFNEGSNDVNFRVEADAADPTQNTSDPGTDGVTQTHLAHDPAAALFVDGSNGRVGLGTSTPATTLHVAGSAHIEGDLWVKGNTNQVDTLVHVTSAMDITNKGTGPALTVTQTGTQPVLTVMDDNITAFHIEDGGNVGINTADPDRLLDISFNKNNSAETDYRNIEGVRVINLNTTAGSKTGINLSTPGSSMAMIGERVSEDSMRLLFIGEGATSTDGNPQPIMSLRNNSGDVAIGKTDPTEFSGLTFTGHMLDVLGVIQTRSGTINMGGATYRKAAISTPTGDSDAPYLEFGVTDATNSSSIGTSGGWRMTNSGLHSRNRHNYITFYANEHADHSIGSRDAAGNNSDDIRINTYGSFFVNLDSNSNNTDTADFVVGRHGSTGTITANNTMFNINGESGQVTIKGMATNDFTAIRTTLGGTNTNVYYTDWQAAGGFTVKRAKGTAGDLSIGIDTTDGSAWTGTGGDIHFKTNKSGTYGHRVTVKSDGDVGIGTDDPTAALDIVRPDTEIAELKLRGGAQGSGRLYVGQSNVVGAGLMYNGDDNPDELGAGDDVILFRRDNSIDHAVIKWDHDSSVVYFSDDIHVPDQIVHTGDTDTYMQFNAADSWRVVTGGSERFEVDNTRTYSRVPVEIYSSQSLPNLSLRNNTNGGSASIYFSSQQTAETTTPSQSGSIGYWHSDNSPDLNDETWANAFVFEGSETTTAFIFDTNTKGTGASGDTAIQKLIPSKDNTGYIGTDTNTWRRGYFTNMYVDGNIYHIGDTNTYIGFDAADNWRVVTGGIERLRVDNNTSTFQTDVKVDGGHQLYVGDGADNTRLHIKKKDNDVSDHLIFYNGTTRMGEIGCQDTTWLRINQVTDKNIYTPRYIRADNGFFVDDTTKGIDGNGNFIGGTIAGASDYGTLLRSDANDVATGRIIFKANETNDWDTIATSTGSQGSIEVFNNESGKDAFMAFHAGSDFAVYFGLDATTNDLSVGGWSMGANKYRVWHAGNQGAGSGLDADTLDTLDSTQFLRSDQSDMIDGTLTVTGDLIPNDDNEGNVGTSDNTWSNGQFTNMTINSTLNVRGAIDLADSDILRFGSGDDVEFFCNGSHMYTDLNSGIGNWYIRDGTTTRFTFDDSGVFTATSNIRSGGDVIPNSGSGGNVGTANNTWSNGRFTNMTIDTTLNVSNDVVVSNAADGATYINPNRIEMKSGTNGFYGFWDVRGDERDFHGRIGYDNNIDAWNFSTGLQGTQDTNGVWSHTAQNYIDALRMRIGTTGLDVAGDITAFYDYSDERLKTNITALESTESLDKVLSLQGVMYQWKDVKHDKHAGDQVGFVAQQVEQVVPQVVKQSKRIDDDEMYKQVEYDKIVPLLVESIKAQQTQIEQLKAEIEQLKQQ